MNQFKKITILILISIFFGNWVQGQQNEQAYWIFLSDKNDVTFDPYAYFDQKAIDRRMKHNLSLSHFTDWPLNNSYIQIVKENSDSILGQTRWFNAIAVMANPEQIIALQKLSCVREVRPMKYYAVTAATEHISSTSDIDNDKKNQLESMEYHLFQEAGIDGKGVRIAIFDGGFPGVNTISALKPIIESGRLIMTWDFTKNKENVFYSISHGTNVMSCIGGVDFDGNAIGMATGAEYLLAKTEIKREPYSEEKNWLEAVEWADKNGAEIINSSLGYTSDRYFQEDMDGEKSLVAKAANMAASKGILVVNAAGNDGDSGWEIIGTPADADSVLAIGGVSPESLIHISFSSYGPTATGTMKPNVCAFGQAYVAEKGGGYSIASGTSFASPLVAGFAACALQANPNLKTMELFHLIEQSGHLYPYFDYAHGFGIPQASYILNQTRDSIPFSLNTSQSSDGIFAEILYPGKFQIGEYRYLYANISNSDGLIIKYKVIKINQSKIEVFSNEELEDLFFDQDDSNLQVSFFYSGCHRSMSIQEL